MSSRPLFKAQDTILGQVFAGENALAPGATLILAGGTALARGYLNHRISWDLDFFMDQPFDPSVLARRLVSIGIALEDPALEAGGTFATQLHGYVAIDEEPIKVSFVEDIFTGMFETSQQGNFRTEVIEGLYHRKLRTITGTGEIQSPAGHILGQGARQKARDLFDLYVLDKTIRPIDEFIQEVNAHGANLSCEMLYQGFATMPWREMMDEFDQLVPIEPFKRITAFEAKRYFDEVIIRLRNLENSNPGPTL